MVRGWCDNQMVELTVLVATRATRSLCSAMKLVNADYSVETRRTQSVLRRSGGGCTLLQRCGMRDFLSIRVRESCETNAITFSTMKREFLSLKSELRALRTGHLSTSEVSLPWTLEEKLRHESNGHAEYDNRCEICVKSSGISRHPRRVYGTGTGPLFLSPRTSLPSPPPWVGLFHLRPFFGLFQKWILTFECFLQYYSVFVFSLFETNSKVIFQLLHLTCRSFLIVVFIFLKTKN